MTVRIWERVQEHKWECVSVLEGHERSIYSLSWGKGKDTGDGKLGWLASTGGDGTVFVWEVNVRLRTAFTSFDWPLTSFTQATPGNPDGGKSRLSHKAIARLSATHGVHDVNGIVWCPREGFEDTFATAGDDGLVKVWKVGHD